MAKNEINLDSIEERILTGFLAKMRADNMTFHEVLEWWNKTGKVMLFHINNQLIEEEKKNEV